MSAGCVRATDAPLVTRPRERKIQAFVMAEGLNSRKNTAFSDRCVINISAARVHDPFRHFTILVSSLNQKNRLKRSLPTGRHDLYSIFRFMKYYEFPNC